MIRVVLLLSLVGCTEARPPAAEEVPVEQPAPVAFDVGDLDASSTSSVPIAIDRFVAGQSDREEAAAFSDLKQLLLFFDDVEGHVHRRIESDKAFDDAIAHWLGECDSCDTSSLAAVDELERDGLRVRRVDGRLVEVDRVALRRRLEPVLRPNALAYYDALIWDVEHVGRMDPPSAPDDIARALVLWETVYDAGAPYASSARSHAVDVAELYLGLCIVPDEDEPPRCVIDKQMRASYERFLAEHTTSQWHPAVAHYLEQASKRGFAMSTFDAIRLSDESRMHARHR